MNSPVRIDSKLPAVGTTIFTVMSRMAAEFGAINLSQGFPDFDCDPALVDAVARHMRAGQNQYAPMQGVLRLREAIAAILQDAGIKAQVTGFELMFHVGFGLDAPARNYRDLLKSDKALYVKFAHALLGRGVRVLERGAWFVSSEHNDAVIDATLEAVQGAAKEIS